MQNVYNIISNWLSDNFLKLNDSKSEIILIGTPHYVSLCKNTATSINLGNTNIAFSSTVKNLGVLIDESLTFVPHIKNCRKTSFFKLKNLRHIRNYFNRSSFESIINALITSKLDYCNSLFINLPASYITLLQSIQNYAARLILRRGLYSSVQPLLFHLHWLPVKDRITFKILLITYKIIHLSEPNYLVSQLKLKTSARTLRNQDNLTLETPWFKNSARMGDCSFFITAPKLWNSLPLNIRSAPSVDSFKSLPKKHLFPKHYQSYL